jgi:hypothetical protein
MTAQPGFGGARSWRIRGIFVNAQITAEESLFGNAN